MSDIPRPTFPALTWPLTAPNAACARREPVSFTRSWLSSEATALAPSGACELVVQVNIGFQREANTSEALFNWCVANWPTMIENLWNDDWQGRVGPQTWGCCKVRFRVCGRVSQGAADHHQITIESNRPHGTIHSGIGTSAQTGVWPAEDPEGVIAAHETGHLMGLYDEYGANSEPTHCAPPASDCIGVSSMDLKCIMASTESPLTVIALPDEIDQILNGLHASCSPRCCLHGVIDRPRRWDGWRAAAPPFDVPGSGGLPPFHGLPPHAVLELARGKTAHVLAHAVEELLHRPADSVVDLTDLLLQGPEDVRWMAAIALSRARGPEVRSALRRALQDPSISVRIQAARSLLEQGWTTGLDVLVDALESDESVIRHPPALARDYAHQVLQHYTGQNLGFDPFAGSRRHALARWRAYAASQHRRVR